MNHNILCFPLFLCFNGSISYTRMKPDAEMSENRLLEFKDVTESVFYSSWSDGVSI